MPRIYRMDPHLADLIAAGEVVERPGSVVKELMENSIDAGAKNITVEIRAGGMTAIRITDDGCGMSEEDAAAAFLRHATSKLRREEDLEAIGTLGFRGEALAAVAAVSRITLQTRERGSEAGTCLELEGGTLMDQYPAGCPVGTMLQVRDLFFNTPARLKFMKNDKAEGSAVTGAVIRCALSHPEVSVRYLKDGKEEFHTPGDGSAGACIYSLFGREFFSGLLPVEAADDAVRVTGFVSSPYQAWGNRSRQFFFVNGRYVKSYALQTALEHAYRNVLFTGKFPSCVLHIQMRPSAVDVNVHPTKIEVKFLNEKQVFDGVYYGVKGALERDESLPGLSAPAPERKEPARAKAPRAAESAPGLAPAPKPPAPPPALPEREEPTEKAPAAFAGFQTSIPHFGKAAEVQPLQDETRIPYRTRWQEEQKPETVSAVSGEERAAAPEEPKLPERPEPEVSEQELPDYRLIGEGLATYLILESEDKLILIDKHAAHERMIFDRLQQQARPVMAQTLLSPVVCRLGAEECSCLLQQQAALTELGFELDSFGEDSVAVHQVPADMDTGDIRQMLWEISAKLMKTGAESLSALRDELLHSVACKAAIKAGRRSDPAELRVIAQAVLSGRVRYCPHGRPVAMELTRSMLDKGFRRI